MRGYHIDDTHDRDGQVYITTQKAAVLSGCKLDNVKFLIYTNRIEYIRVKRRIFVLLESLIDYLDRVKRESAESITRGKLKYLRLDIAAQTIHYHQKYIWMMYQKKNLPHFKSVAHRLYVAEKYLPSFNAR